MRQRTTRFASLLACAALATGALLLSPARAAAQEALIGEIRMFGGNFAPRGWAFCEGQLLPIAENTALFSILGTTYGGDGRTTFALPDLRGRFPLHASQGPGLSPRTLGEVGGTESVTLGLTQIPSHAHQLQAVNAAGSASSPAGALQAAGRNFYAAGVPNATLAAAAVTASGGSQPHDNMPPYLGVNFIIALFGIYPSRN